MATIINDLYESLNPTFYRLLLTDAPNKLVKGGRSGTKSSAVAEILVDGKMRNKHSNIICFRQKQNSLRLSVYNQISWALHKHGVADQFNFRGNPMTILHKRWGTGFYFMGMDDPQKVKGMIIEQGYVTDLWFEEADSLRGKEEIDTVADTFIRADLPDGQEVETWVTFNPPRNPHHWVNEWAVELIRDEDWFIHHSTYLDDVRGYNSQQILRKIETYKKNDPDYYAWMYLGEIIGMGTNIYNMALVKMIDELPTDDPVIKVFYSADTGHQVSATSVGAYALTAKGNVIRLGGYYYKPAGQVNKKAPSELAQGVFDYIKDMGYVPSKYTIDSAEGGFRNQYRKDFGVMWHGVGKKQKHVMIDHTHDLLAQGRFFVLDNEENKVFIEQMRKYEWDDDTIKSDAPKPLKVDDDTVDEFQYFVTDNLRTLGLRR